MGQTIWENTQSYIDNSPILKADKVKTPVLLMNDNKERLRCVLFPGS